jgi:hypothetical protein
MPFARQIRSRAVPYQALTRCLLTTTSPASGVTAGWMSATGALTAGGPARFRSRKTVLRALISRSPGRKTVA